MILLNLVVETSINYTPAELYLYAIYTSCICTIRTKSKLKLYCLFNNSFITQNLSQTGILQEQRMAATCKMEHKFLK